MIVEVILEAKDAKGNPDPSFLPVMGTEQSAGYDVRAYLPDEGFGIRKPIDLGPGQMKLVSLGFRMSLAPDFIGDIEYTAPDQQKEIVTAFLEVPSVAAVLLPRSGLGSRGLVLGNTVGLIDADYQGTMMACLYNRSTYDYVHIDHGDRIAQLVFLPVIHPNMRVCDDFSINTTRGEGGFGHTGV